MFQLFHNNLLLHSIPKLQYAKIDYENYHWKGLISERVLLLPCSMDTRYSLPSSNRIKPCPIGVPLWKVTCKLNLVPSRSSWNTPTSSRSPQRQQPLKLVQGLPLAQQKSAVFPEVLQRPLTISPTQTSPFSYQILPFPVRIQLKYLTPSSFIDPWQVNLSLKRTMAFLDPLSSSISQTQAYRYSPNQSAAFLKMVPLVRESLAHYPVTKKVGQVCGKQSVPLPWAFLS